MAQAHLNVRILWERSASVCVGVERNKDASLSRRWLANERMSDPTFAPFFLFHRNDNTGIWSILVSSVWSVKGMEGYDTMNGQEGEKAMAGQWGEGGRSWKEKAGQHGLLLFDGRQGCRQLKGERAVSKTIFAFL